MTELLEAPEDLETRAELETVEADGYREIGEPLVYRVSERRSYFKDLFMRQRGDSEAGERVERHGRQMATAEVDTSAVVSGVSNFRCVASTTWSISAI